MKRKILIVEDEKKCANSIVRFLSGINAISILEPEKDEYRIDCRQVSEGDHLIGKILKLAKMQKMKLKFDEIIIARTKKKAEEIFNREKDNIVLILLDLSIPKEDIYETHYWHGKELLEVFLKIKENKRPWIILISQYIDEIILMEMLDIIIRYKAADELSFLHKEILESQEKNLLLAEMQTLTSMFYLRHYFKTLVSSLTKSE